MTSLIHHNPEGLHHHPAFTQAVEVPAGAATVYIGGQNGTDVTGTLVSDTAAGQASKALDNVRIAVEAVGGTIADIAKWTILVSDHAHVGPGFQAFNEFWDPNHAPPAITVQVVSGLASPEYLVEIEAIAAITR